MDDHHKINIPLSLKEKEKEKIDRKALLIGIEVFLFILNFMIQMLLCGINNIVWISGPYLVAMALIITFTLVYSVDYSLKILLFLIFLFIIFVSLDFFLNIRFSEERIKYETLLKVIYGFKIAEVLNYIAIIITILVIKTCFINKGSK
jgi:hypothetical protein